MTTHRPVAQRTVMPKINKKTGQLKTTGLPRDAALEAAEGIVDAALARTDPDGPRYSKLVQSIVDADPDYRWSPGFPRAVVAAVNMHLDYMRECRERYPEHWIDEITEDTLEEHDLEHIKRIARAVHIARIGAA